MNISLSIQLPLGQAQWIVNSYTGWNGGYRFYYWLVESSLSQLQDWAWLTVHPASVFIKDSFFLTYGQEERRMTTVHPTGRVGGFSFFHKLIFSSCQCFWGYFA
ncbi:hypothetical protein PilKf_00354 [Pillotina sp. SPG140]|jgi:hypothetical protein